MEKITNLAPGGAWIVIGGIGSVASALLARLPADLAPRAVQAKHLDVHATKADVAARAREMASTLRDSQDLERIKQALTSAAANGVGTTGSLDTKRALEQGSAREVYFTLDFLEKHAAAAEEIVRLALGSHAQPDAALPIRDVQWDLLHWVRYVAATHLVRIVAGTFFRATPVWTFYLRLNGARVGHRVYVNSLSVMDHNLLEFGEGTVVGADVHLSGHIVEDGVVRTAGVRTGRNVTLGTGSVIGIGVDIGDGTQVGALSLVPKHSKLAAHAVYFGIPVQRADAPELSQPSQSKA